MKNSDMELVKSDFQEKLETRKEQIKLLKTMKIYVFFSCGLFLITIVF